MEKLVKITGITPVREFQSVSNGIQKVVRVQEVKATDGCNEFVVSVFNDDIDILKRVMDTCQTGLYRMDIAFSVREQSADGATRYFQSIRLMRVGCY